MDSQTEFPKFRDGDVTVVISVSRVYQLHSHVLRRLSPFFAGQLNAYPGAKLTAAARRDGASAYHFELNKRSPDEFGQFIRVKVNDNGRPQRENYMYPPIAVNYDGNDNEERIWDWLFGSFYHIKPNFEDHNLATVLTSCMDLVDAADRIGSIDHVRGIVDHALLNQDQALWTSIAANPTAWTELGCRIHSQRIFREGMIHLIGLWNTLSLEDKGELRDEVRTLCEVKHQELDFAKKAIETRILGHYPHFIHRSHVDKPDRTSYSTDIYMWMAISFFRHFFAQAISDGRTRLAEDGGFQFYNQLAQGGDAYLHHEDFRAFHQYFPMSGKACNVLEANMNVLKEDVKGFVQDLVLVRSHLKPGESAIKWLTCAMIEKKDYPWEAQEKAASEAKQMLVDRAMASNQELSEEDDGDDVDMTPDILGSSTAADSYLNHDMTNKPRSKTTDPRLKTKGQRVERYSMNSSYEDTPGNNEYGFDTAFIPNPSYRGD